MRLKLLSLAVVGSLAVFLAGLRGAEAQSSASAAAKTGVFWIVPHTHWEGAVFRTREEYLQTGLVNILRAMNLLKRYPDYRFTLDQACYVKPFLERYPEQEAAFRKLIAEGRLAIVGGMDVMPDVNMPSGESCIRQIQYGKGYFRRKLGLDVTVAWHLDSFGHHAQLPQILKLAGFQSFWFLRGVRRLGYPGRILLGGARRHAHRRLLAAADAADALRLAPEVARVLALDDRPLQLACPGVPGRDRVGLAGNDVAPPEEHLPALVQQYNRQPNAPLRALLCRARGV